MGCHTGHAKNVISQDALSAIDDDRAATRSELCPLTGSDGLIRRSQFYYPTKAVCDYINHVAQLAYA
jgi:hypothetical protein